MKKLLITFTSLLLAGLVTTINSNLKIGNVIALELNNNISNLKAEVVSPGMRTEDEYTIIGPKNLLTGYEPKNPDGTINVVVEIPTGTLAKWEVTKPDGKLEWEFKNGLPRVVQYLGYPGNYGMIPKSLLLKELGGDGDPLDVIVLGPAVPRGSVVPVKLIGVLKLLDGGEQDDKLIAIMKDTPLYEVDSIADLDSEFPGVTTIVKTWFANYKGPGEIEVIGLAEKDEALEVFNSAVAAFAAEN
ncbi:MAG: inorganic diphosphatase [Microcoleaceae cyanobacterium]